MKFLIDECVWASVAKWFKSKNFDVVSITEEFSGYTDIQVLEKAYNEERVLVTRDKDFGDIVFRQKKNHCGVLLLRFKSEISVEAIVALEKFFMDLTIFEQLKNNFVVLANGSVRIIDQQILH